ncbi:MAG: ribosome silencing factor [Gammaproteobacteria bacterium]|nr:ribosome silencing factor [Gammaproteobacteria bacterium]MDH5730797.1 ribosome silencing factor [Gammaproteobacteria bacterium]
MQLEQLKDLVVDALDDLKAKDIRVIDVRGLSNVTDLMVVATGSSSRQVQSMAQHLEEKVKQAGVTPLGSEADKQAEWVLVDLGELVVHIMQQAVRDYYQLERLWSTPMAGESAFEDEDLARAGHG